LKWRNTAEYFGIVNISVHWLSALVIFGLFFLGLWMVDLDYYSHWYHRAPHLHKSFGLILIIITLFRIVWVSLNPKPVSLSQIKWQKQLATFIHYNIYLLLFTLFISGYVVTTADGSSIYLFDWLSLPAIVTGNEALVEPLALIHQYGAYLLIALIALHVIGAFKHHFIEKNVTLMRMLSPNKK
jgi:cytochrome b561